MLGEGAMVADENAGTIGRATGRYGGPNFEGGGWVLAWSRREAWLGGESCGFSAYTSKRDIGSPNHTSFTGGWE